MALGDPLSLKNAALADVTFSRESSITDKQGVTTSKFTDGSQNPQTPRLLVVKQSITGQGAARVRRTLVRVEHTKLDSALRPFLLTYNDSWVYPLNGLFTATDLDDAICIASDLLLSTSSLAVDATKRAALLLGIS